LADRISLASPLPKCNVKSEPAPVADHSVRFVITIDGDRIFLAPCIIVHAVGHLKNVLWPRQLMPRNAFDLKGNRYPVG